MHKNCACEPVIFITLYFILCSLVQWHICNHTCHKCLLPMPSCDNTQVSAQMFQHVERRKTEGREVKCLQKLKKVQLPMIQHYECPKKTHRIGCNITQLGLKNVNSFLPVQSLWSWAVNRLGDTNNITTDYVSNISSKGKLEHLIYHLQ